MTRLTTVTTLVIANLIAFRHATAPSNMKSRANKQKLVRAQGHLNVASESLEHLRNQLLIIHDAVAESDADDSAKNLTALCIKTCRELAIQMRTEARAAEPEGAKALAQAGLGIAVLSSWIVAGVATGASDAFATEHIQSQIATAADQAERACIELSKNATPSDVDENPGDLAVKRAVEVLSQLGAPIPTLDSETGLKEIEIVLKDAMSHEEQDPSGVLSTFSAEIAQMRRAWLDGHAELVIEASDNLVRRAQHYL